MQGIDLSKAWSRPFMTPMNIAAYNWAASIVAAGHTGGVLYAPTRMGKSKTIELLREALQEFDGPRGVIQSVTLSTVAYDRKRVSEGGFWDWMLQELGHFQSGRRLSPIQKRHCVCEFMKGKAATVPSGRVILFIDEGQFLEQEELGWVADMFNNMAKDHFQLVVFFVGSFLLQKWLTELRGKPQQHVMARFFTNGHRLGGLKSVADFKACLRHFDESPIDPESGMTAITEAHLPDWYASGGRLEGLGDNLHEAFRHVAQWRPKDVDVPMQYFIHAVRRILDYGEQNSDPQVLAEIVIATGFDQWLVENEVLKKS